MRSVFGPFIVLNEDTYTTSVYGWYDESTACCTLSTTQGFGLMYTNT
jgi:hypothetical protein